MTTSRIRHSRECTSSTDRDPETLKTLETAFIEPVDESPPTNSHRHRISPAFATGVPSVDEAFGEALEESCEH